MNVIQFPKPKDYVKPVPKDECYTSPYLLKPIRTYEQVIKDIAKREEEDRHNRALKAIE